MINVKMVEKGLRFDNPRKNENRTPLEMIKEISQLMDDFSECEELKELCDTDRLIIDEIARKEGRSQIEIGESLRMKKPTVSIALKRLEKEGYVARVADDYDHRAMRIYLTDKGKTAERAIRTKMRENENNAIRGLTTNECNTIKSLLEKIYNNLEK